MAELSTLGVVYFFTTVRLLEEIRRRDPERADQLRVWLDEWLQGGGVDEVVRGWRQQLAVGRDIELPPLPPPSSAPTKSQWAPWCRFHDRPLWLCGWFCEKRYDDEHRQCAMRGSTCIEHADAYRELTGDEVDQWRGEVRK